MKKKPIHKPKHIIRELKKAALRDLEPMKYEAFAYLSKPYFQDAEGKFHDTWEKGRRLVDKFIETFQVNHERRIKKMYQKFGVPGAIAYYDHYKKKENPEN